MNMSDLISRKAVIDKIEDIDMQVYEGNAAIGRRILLTKEEVIYAMNDIPSVEPERKRGEWIYDGKRGRFPACKCSICGHYENADWTILQGVNFCPHCGADMRDEYEDIPMEYFENGGI